MPYNSDADVPDHVPKRLRSRWRHIWNSVFKQTKSEKRAFKAANSILSNEKRAKDLTDKDIQLVIDNYTNDLGMLDKGVDYFYTNTVFANENSVDSILSNFGIQRHPHMMYVGFKLLHFDTPNSNGCIIPIDEANERSWSVVNVPIDWEHSVSTKNMPFTFVRKAGDVGIIGHVIAQKVVVPQNGNEQAQIDENKLFNIEKDEKPFLFALGVIHKSKFKEDAEQIQGRFSNGELTFSMECRYTKLQCPECSKIIDVGTDSTDEPCEHLENYFFFHSVSDKKVNSYVLEEVADKIMLSSDGDIQPYILRDVHFTGASIVERPADKKAYAISLGADNKMISDIIGGEKLMYREFETQEDFDKEINLHISKAKAELESLSKDEKASFSDAIKQRENKIVELTKRVGDLESEVTKVTEEYDDYKTSIESAKTLTERLAKLAEIEYVVDSTDEAHAKFISEMSEDSFSVFVERQKKLIETLKNKNTNTDMTKGSDNASALKGADKSNGADDKKQDKGAEEKASEEIKLKEELGKYLKRNVS